MGYGLRVEPVLTKDGRDAMDREDLRLLLSIRDGGLSGAALTFGLSERSVRRRVRRLETRIGEPLIVSGRLSPLGNELVETMGILVERLEDQVKNLWRRPTLTCDGLLVRDGRVLLVRRAREPFKGRYALPGGFVEYGEKVEECVVREVREETGLETEVARLMGVYSSMGRDPRGHFVTLLFLLNEKGGRLNAGDDAEEANFFEPSALPPMAFDHQRLIEDAFKDMGQPLS